MLKPSELLKAIQFEEVIGSRHTCHRLSIFPEKISGQNGGEEPFISIVEDSETGEPIIISKYDGKKD